MFAIYCSAMVMTMKILVRRFIITWLTCLVSILNMHDTLSLLKTITSLAGNNQPMEIPAINYTDKSKTLMLNHSGK